MKDSKDIYLLSLDTTSRNASIAVIQNGNLLLEYNFVSRDELSASLIGMIEFVLESSQVKLDDIDIVSVVVGPGLFTGIRVGLTTVKGLTFNENIPIVPVNSLESTAYKFKDCSKTIIPLIDARREEVYYAGYSNLKELIPPGLCNYREIVKKISEKSNIMFVGDGAQKYSDYLLKSIPGCTIIQRSKYIACEAGLIGFEKYKRGNYLSGQRELLPLYIRKPDALLSK